MEHQNKVLCYFCLIMHEKDFILLNIHTVLAVSKDFNLFNLICVLIYHPYGSGLLTRIVRMFTVDFSAFAVPVLDF